MNTVTLTDLKNRLGAFMDKVKAGRSFIVLDRNRPVARITPIAESEQLESDEQILERAERMGIIKRGSGKLDIAELDRNRVTLDPGVSVLEALLEERREGR